MRKTFLSLLGLALAAGGLATIPSQRVPAVGPARFVYRSPSGVAFEVTAEGLSAIQYRNKEVARGSWGAFNAENWFNKEAAAPAKAERRTLAQLEVVRNNHARVRHVQGELACLTDYLFEGEDVTVSARVENNHPTAPLNVVGFSGLTFHFDRPPTGLMPVSHISFFQAKGIGTCHPGYYSKVGGTYATDSAIGIGTSPLNTGLSRTLTLWDYTDWNVGKREKVPERRLLYLVPTPIPPRGAASFDFRLRVSPNLDWKHLLDPYRQHFRATFGPVAYRADYRWIASDYLNRGVQSNTEKNPYGYQPGRCRIDLEEGAQAFCDHFIPTLQKNGGQGVILWAQGGQDPRGAMYRPDFDVLPPEVEAQWPKMAARFKSAGLKLGVTTRPRHLAVRVDWKTDGIIDINADDPGHRDMLWRRFQKMIDLGCTLFYLDSFGDSLEDVKLMRFLRSKMGPEILTFAEHQSDATMPFSGGYSETTYEMDAAGKPAYKVWSGLENWERYEYLVPGAQLISRLYEKTKLPADTEPIEPFLVKHRITPLIAVGHLGRTDGLKELQAQFPISGK